MKRIFGFLILVVIFTFARKHKEQSHSPEYSAPFTNNEKPVLIHGLGEYNREDLLKAREILKEEFNIQSKICSSKRTEPSLYSSNHVELIAEKVLSQFRVEGENVVYVTSEPLISRSGENLRGMTHLGGTVIVLKGGVHLKETLIHEMGHTFGLTHCDDETCIMAINNDETDSGEFCRKCRKTLNEVRNAHGKK